MTEATGQLAAAPVPEGSREGPLRPDYGGACIDSIVPALFRDGGTLSPPWLPSSLAKGLPVVLLVLDGLGEEQLGARWHLTPVMATMERSTITSVAPTTTAAALTSIVTGQPPAIHGVVGYRVRVDGGLVMNVLRWTTPSGDARQAVRPRAFQQLPSFLGRRVPVVTRGEFVGTGFTDAHLFGSEIHGWRQASSLPVIVADLVLKGAPFVYAYYDGIDSVAHETGLGDFYDAELSFVDRLIGDLLDRLPGGVALAVTSDHGQVEVRSPAIHFDPKVISDVTAMSGEGRFRWLHVAKGKADDVARRLGELYGEVAWVRTVDELTESGYFGGPLSDHFRRRLGDVAVMAHQPVTFADPADPGDMHLVSRHGSLTSAELFVPLLGTSR
jgi:hypothetical protein